MNPPRTKSVRSMLLMALVTSLFVVACGGSNTGTPAAVDSNGTSTSGSNSAAVSLADAYQNLVNQQSFTMTAKLSNLKGSFASLPGITDPTTITFQRTGADRKVQLIISTGRTVFTLWRVDGQIYIDYGLGPAKSSANDAFAKQLVPLLDADQQIINGLSAQNAVFTVNGTEKVNGVQSTRESARYDLSQAADSIFSTSASNSVNAKIWVARAGGFLTKADLTLNATGNSTAAANAGADVVLDVTAIGTTPDIKAPL